MYLSSLHCRTTSFTEDIKYESINASHFNVAEKKQSNISCTGDAAFEPRREYETTRRNYSDQREGMDRHRMPLSNTVNIKENKKANGENLPPIASWYRPNGVLQNGKQSVPSL